jgi:hypothetical protein
MKNVAHMAATLAKVGLALVALSALAAPGVQAARLPEGFTEESANVDGVKINYKIGGRGPVVVLLHGYTQGFQAVQGRDHARRAACLILRKGGGGSHGSVLSP